MDRLWKLYILLICLAASSMWKLQKESLMIYSDRNLRGLCVRSNTLFASIVKTLLFRPVECLGINWIILARLTHSVGLQGEPNAVFTMCTKTPICKEIKCPFPQKSVLYSSTSISVLVGDFPFHESVFFTLCTSKAVIGRFPGSDFQEFSSCRLEICCHCSRRWVTLWSNQASSWTQPRPAGVMHSCKRSL